MKKTKRILGLLLAVMMVFATLPVGAAFTDVADELPQWEAVQVLSGLGLIAGYKEGDKTLFKPEGQITRAEFTAMLTRALKLAEIGAVATTPFEDVADGHWASANIRIAYDMGIIAGYDAKTFGPEDNVTYEQAIKMMVCALGFGNQALERGGWPAGYVNVALDKKLLGKVGGTNNKPATRADIAQMIYNAFDVSIAIEGGVKADGTPDFITVPGRTLLTEKLELNSISGQVTGTNMTRLDDGEGIGKKNCIEVEGVLISVAAETDQSALLGREVTVYYETDDTGDKTAKYIHQALGSNQEMTVTYDQIVDTANDELVYEGTDGEDVTLEFDDLQMIYNKKHIAGEPEDVLDIQTGEITFLDADGDEFYDVAFIREYKVVHVNKVDAVNYVVTDYNSTGTTLTLKPTTSSRGDQLKIYKDGKEVAFSTIRNRTTLCIYETLNTNGDKLTEVHVSAKSVHGKIEKIRQGKYTIAGKEYGMSYYCNETLELGQESTFYLDLSNNIVDTAAVALAGTKLYGYLTDVRYNEDTEKVTLRLLPAGEDEIQSIVCADTTVLDGVQVKNHALIRDQLALAAQETNKDGGSNTEYSQLIMYGVASGKVNAINTLLEGGSETSTTNLTPFSGLGEYTGSYKASSKKFDFNSGITVGSGTKIFVVPSDRKNMADYTTSLNLKDGKEYTVEAFEKSTVGVAGAVVIYGGVGIDEIAVDAPIYLVSDDLESMVTDKDESFVRIPLINVLTGASSTVDATASDLVAANLKKGDIIRYATNADGTIRKGLCELLFDPTGDRPAADDRTVTDTTAFMTRYGTLYSADNSSKQILFTTIFPDEGSSENARDLYSYSSAKIYVYDTVAEKEEDRIVPHSTTVNNMAYAQAINLIPAGTQPSTVFLYLSDSKVKFAYIVR